MLTELLTDMNGTAKTLAAGHLFNVRDDAKIAQEYCPEFPSSGCKTILSIQKNTTGHPDDNSILVY